ncbi:hypothetical protein DSM100238_1751 [Bifidobacterium apri]|uniref:Uncharacterized protein n=1 Tax=Bifidobacterium apri TaxID=1769423 RepID=A0A6A2V659_9BIFI|nr:hypothetical protein DSM100238_1751 [Bifidobacterium apri]
MPSYHWGPCPWRRIRVRGTTNLSCAGCTNPQDTSTGTGSTGDYDAIDRIRTIPHCRCGRLRAHRLFTDKMAYRNQSPVFSREFIADTQIRHRSPSTASQGDVQESRISNVPVGSSVARPPKSGKLPHHARENRHESQQSTISRLCPKGWCMRPCSLRGVERGHRLVSPLMDK